MDEVIWSTIWDFPFDICDFHFYPSEINSWQFCITHTLMKILDWSYFCWIGLIFVVILNRKISVHFISYDLAILTQYLSMFTGKNPWISNISITSPIRVWVVSQSHCGRWSSWTNSISNVIRYLSLLIDFVAFIQGILVIILKFVVTWHA